MRIRLWSSSRNLPIEQPRLVRLKINREGKPSHLQTQMREKMNILLIHIVAVAFIIIGYLNREDKEDDF